jgi:hypothetical protein
VIRSRATALVRSSLRFKRDERTGPIVYFNVIRYGQSASTRTGVMALAPVAPGAMASSGASPASPQLTDLLPFAPPGKGRYVTLNGCPQF